MFTKVDEIWYYPFKDADEIPEMVKRVCSALLEISKMYQSDLTDGELLERGIDPDMVNEFCMFDESEWPELEKYYADEDGFWNMETAELVGTKEYRARQIWEGIDPETGQPLNMEAVIMPTYEEWKAGLTEGQREFPHSMLVGSGEPPEYVARLVREREEFEEMAQKMERGELW